MQNRSRILKVIAALAVAGVYIFVFGIIRVVDVSADNSHQIEVNVPMYTTQNLEQPITTPPLKTDKPAQTTKAPQTTEEGQTAPEQTESTDPDVSQQETPPPVQEAPNWKETAYKATMVVNTDGICSRKRAELGAETADIYYAGDRVNVVAWTDTEYYKLEDGNFIHAAYLDDLGGDNSIPDNNSGGGTVDTSGGSSSVSTESTPQTSRPETDNSSNDTSSTPNSEPDNSGTESSGSDSSDPGNVGNGEDTFTVYDEYSGMNVTADAYEVVVRTVINEIGTTWPDEAIKAQAVAAYTHIKKENLSGNTPTVALQPMSSATDRVLDLVDEVFGEAIYYGGELINCSYYASSCGYTNSSENEWGGYLPYLVSVDCPFDEADPNYGLKTTFTASQVKSIIANNHGITLSGNKANWIKVNGTLGQKENGWVTSVSVGGTAFHGKTLRADFSLPSEAFTVTYNSSTDKFTFTTYGYGHGVGMSQNGAKILADNGYSYKEILKHYFTGVTVE